MSTTAFVERQIFHIRRGGRPVLIRKVRKTLRIFLSLPFYVLALPAVVMIRLIRPWLLVRLDALESRSIGHFAADVELYLCERDAGLNQSAQRHVDLFHMYDEVCNQQLALMWKRVLKVWPYWILGPLRAVDRMLPGTPIPECGDNARGDRDVYNLLDRIPPHLEFTAAEEAQGEAGLRSMGIAKGQPFVCLNVRDSAYHAQVCMADAASQEDEAAFRSSDLQNYVMAAEALANRGYVVVRMGAVVREALGSRHPGVIDYATNGMRSDFMDVYLGAKCAFCISVSSGFDAVPTIFRRPVAFVNVAPLGVIRTSSARNLCIGKRYFPAAGDKELSLRQIFARGVGHFLLDAEYKAAGIRLVENTPEEIRDLVIEMADRLEGAWQPRQEDEELQRRFWENFPKNAPGRDREWPWHGEFRARFGAAYLREHRAWLDC